MIKHTAPRLPPYQQLMELRLASLRMMKDAEERKLSFHDFTELGDLLNEEHRNLFIPTSPYKEC